MNWPGNFASYMGFKKFQNNIEWQQFAQTTTETKALKS